MKLWDVIDVLLLMRVISVTLARSSPPTLTVNPCQGDEVWIPLPINNSTSGVDLEDVHVYQTPFTSPRGGIMLATPRKRHFQYEINKGFHFKAELDDSGMYTITAMSGQINETLIFVFINVSSEPAASEKELVVHQTSDLWGIQLTCRHFPRLGHPKVSIIWTMPNNKTKKNTTSDDGTYTLDLPYPVDSGTYTCSVRDRTSPAESSTGRKGSALVAAVVVQSKFDKKSVLKKGVCLLEKYWIPLSPGIAVAEYYLGDVEIYQKKSGKLVASVSNGTFSTYYSHVFVQYIPNSGFLFTAGMWDNGTLAIVGKSGHLKGSVTMASINVSKCIQTYGCVGDDVHFLHPLKNAKNVEIFFQPKEAKKTLVATYDNDIFLTVAERNRLESGGGGIFTLVNATLSDSGTYEFHYDFNGQRTSFSYPLTVSGCHPRKDSGYVGDNMHIPLDLRNLSAQCCPQLEIYFQNNAFGRRELVANYVNRIVSTFHGSKLEFTPDEGIRIFNLTLADSGIYTVVAKGSQQKIYLFAKISVQVREHSDALKKSKQG